MLDLKDVPVAVLSIPQFEHLAEAATRAYGARNAKVVIVDEHADTMKPGLQATEADRVAKLLFGVEQ